MKWSSICLGFKECCLNVFYCLVKKIASFFERWITTIFKILVSSGFWILLVLSSYFFTPNSEFLFVSPSLILVSLWNWFSKDKGESLHFYYYVCAPPPPLFLSAFSGCCCCCCFILLVTQKGSIWHCRAVVGWGKRVGKLVSQRDKLGEKHC